jgi:RNA polymerase sigma factor (sigma-70 family)
MTTIDDWLDAASRYPLLTPTEELILARQVQDWLQHPDPCPRPVERRGQRAKRRMIEANLRLVHDGWKKFGRHIPVDPVDLLQQGVLGLDRAVTKYDPTRGYKFSTYAYWWIRQAMGAGERDGSVIRLRSDSATLERKLRAGNELTDAQLQRAKAALLARRLVSLDTPVGDGHDGGRMTLMDIVADEVSGDALEQLHDLEIIGRLTDLHAAMEHLPADARRVLVLLHGLDGQEERSVRYVARELGITARRVEIQRAMAESRLRAVLSGIPVVSMPRVESYVVEAQLPLLEVESHPVERMACRSGRRPRHGREVCQGSLALALGA